MDQSLPLLKTIKEGLLLLDARERKVALLLSVFFVVVGFIEFVTLSMILPTSMLMIEPENLETSQHIEYIYNFLGTTDPETVVPIAVAGVIALLVISSGLSILSSYLVKRLAAYSQIRLCKYFVIKCTQAPYSWYLDKNSAILTRRIYGDLGRWQGGLIQSLMTLFQNIIMIIFVSAVVIITAPQGAVVALVAVGILAGAASIISHPFLKRLTTIEKYESDLFVKKLVQIFAGIKDVKLAGNISTFIDEIDVHQIRRQLAALSTHLWRVCPGIIMVMLGQIGFIMILYIFWESNLSKGEIVGQMTLLALVSSRVVPALNRLVSNLNEIWGSLTFVEGLVSIKSDLLRMEKEQPLQDTDNIPPMPHWANLDLKNIGYTYPNAESASLSNINMSLRKGGYYGIAGFSGAGKTTLVDILLGLHEASSGQILVDGEALKHDRLPAWQKSIGYVPQNPFIADDTLRANVAFGLAPKQVDEDQVMRALQRANLDHFLETLPEGLDTMMGERGVRLSGGQLQRIAIARALYREPEFLVLDEATSALDSDTEKKVQIAIQRIKQDITVVAIAHRINTLVECDEIYVMENGEVVASGKHDELLETSPVFKRLVAKED